jgi:arylsulfatase A-like enzyme
MTRTVKIAWVVFAVAALGWLLAPTGLALAANSKPNIVYILADDLGYGDVGCYNTQSKIPTPNLDRLAREGIRFTDAHAPDAVCTPTRYGLLTGRYCFRSRMKSGVLPPWGGPLIEEGRLTVPALLCQHGYAAIGIGKWHLGWAWPTKDGRPASSKDGLGNIDFSRPIGQGPTTCGFDAWFGVDLPNYPPYCFIRNDRTLGLPSLAAPMQKGGFNRPGPMLPGWSLTNIMPEITRHAVLAIEDSARTAPARPLFLYFALTAPHYPIVPTAEFKGRSRAGDYGDFVAQVDGTVGEVLAALARTGLADNTLLIFTSDNGPECGEIDPGAYARVRRYGHRSMDGLRGVKRDAWEGGHRVPFIARWPGRVPAGKSSDETICHVDLMATCAALLGAKLPPSAGVDSYDILPALLGQKRDRPIREATVLHSGSGKFAIRQGEWVLIDAPSGDDNFAGGEPEWFKKERGYTPNPFPGELYDLRDDLAQRRNRFGERPEVVQRLKALLEKYKADGRSTPGPRQPNTPASTSRQAASIPDENPPMAADLR